MVQQALNRTDFNPTYSTLNIKIFGPAREENETLSPEYMNDWLLRSTELVNKYKPQLFWFDWWIEQAALEPYRKSFTSYYYNKGLEWNKGVVVTIKIHPFPMKPPCWI